MNESSAEGYDANLEKKLEQINKKLSSISANEVLFIITLSFLALFAAVNVFLLILERRNKKKQNSVPQAIVIQPETSIGNDKKLTPKTVTTLQNYENPESYVLPPKSEKVEVSKPLETSNKTKTSKTSEIQQNPKITPSASVSKVQQVSSLNSSKEKAPSNRSSAEPSATAIEPSFPPPPPPTSNTPSEKSEKSGKSAKSVEKSSSFVSFTVPSASESQSAEHLGGKINNDKKTEKSESNFSFTVPEQPTPMHSAHNQIKSPFPPKSTSSSINGSINEKK